MSKFNKIVVIGNANVYHLGGATLNYNTVNKNYLNFRNSLIMLIKNLPKKLKTDLSAFIAYFG